METRRRESREFQPLGFCKGRGSSRTQFGSVYGGRSLIVKAKDC